MRTWEKDIKLDLQKNGIGAWTGLAHDVNKWKALVKTVIYLGFHRMSGICCLAEELSAFQEGIYPVELVTLDQK
jgi:hypothetical protein